MFDYNDVYGADLNLFSLKTKTFFFRQDLEACWTDIGMVLNFAIMINTLLIGL